MATKLGSSIPAPQWDVLLISLLWFCPQGHDQSSTLSQHTAELTLPKHSPLHRDLLRYAKLMEWLKNTHREKYEGLSRVSVVVTFLKKLLFITQSHTNDHYCRSKDQIRAPIKYIRKAKYIRH